VDLRPDGGALSSQPLEAETDPAPAPPSELRGRRILISGINYFPEVSGISPYTTGIAEHLAGRGADVVVLTAMPSYPSWKVFDGYRGTLRRLQPERGVEVHRFRGYVPQTQSALRRAAYEFSFLAHAATHGPLGAAPDVVMGVTPSLSGALLAWLESQKYRCPFGLFVQDLMGPAAAESGMSGGSSVAALTAKLESRVARAATRVGVISDGFRSYLERSGVDPGKIVLLRNWVHLNPVTETRAQTRAALGWPPDTRIVLHTGNMGLKQGLEHVLTAARLGVHDLPNTRFVFQGDGSQRAFLETTAAGAANVEFRDFVDDAAYSNVLAAADVLLVNERASIVDMSLPGKLTSYFASGRPVVAAVHATGGTAREVTAAGAGIVVPAEDSAAVVAALRRLEQDPDLVTRLGAAGRVYAEAELSATACLARVESFVTDLCRPPTGQPAG
jgi:glycosyltransferase involved in cell wall biosynthesis